MRDTKTFFDYAYAEAPLNNDKKLVWNVIVEDVNAREIIPYNIFDHGSFLNDLIKIKKEVGDNYDEFVEKVRRSLSYYYRSKSEWEIIATSWPPYIEAEELDRVNQEKAERLEKGYPFYRESVNLSVGEKLDVYTQIRINWDIFIKYLWENRNLIKKPKN